MSKSKTDHDQETPVSPATRQASPLSRREALKTVTALLGGVALTGGASLLTSCASYDSGEALSESTPFTDAEVALLDDMAETILPRTETPGAKDAGVGAFVAFMVVDAYSPDNRRIFREGLIALQQSSQAEFGTTFTHLQADDQLAVINRLDREQHEFQRGKAGDQPNHWFRMMKELTLLGYFTSEVGMTKALRYVERPGRYDPCAPYEEGDPAWAAHA